MPVRPGPRLQKVTLNLYWEDVRKLEGRPDWSVWVRDLVHNELHNAPKTVGDLYE